MAAGFRDVLVVEGGGLGNQPAVELDGTVSLAFGGTYGLLGLGPLTSPEPVSISATVFGTFTGAGALASAPTLTFTPVGTATLTGVLAGSVGMTLHMQATTESGTFVESTIPVSLNVSGGITGDGPLASTVEIGFFDISSAQPPGFFSLFADWLGGGVAAGAFTGAVANSFSVSGAYTGIGYLQGAVNVSFSANGSYTVLAPRWQTRFRAPLQRPGIGPWHPAFFKRRRGDWQATPLGAAASTVGLTLSGFGALLGIGTLQTNVACGFGVSGVSTEAGSVSSNVSLTFDSATSLLGSGALVSSIEVIIDPEGFFSDPGSFTGVAVAGDFSVAGTMQGEGTLQSTMDMQFDVEGDFPSTWQPVNTRRSTIWTPVNTRG